MKKKLLSLFLTFCMVVSLAPTALAEQTQLPEIGFVTSGDVLTEENQAGDMSYTNDARTYTVALSDPARTIRSVSKNYLNRDKVESVQIAKDLKTAVMTLKPDLDFIRTQVGLDCVLDDGTRVSIKITVINENQYFGYRYCTGIKEPYAEDSAATLKHEPTIAKGSALWMTFARGSWYTNEPVEVKTVTVADPGVAVVTYLGKSNKGNAVYELRSVNFGFTELKVETADGNTYTLPVEVMVPTAGFSRDTALSQESYIHDRKFYYSEGNNVFYYVVSPDIRRTIVSVAIKEPYDKAVTAEVSSDKKMIKFTVDPASGINNVMIEAETVIQNVANRITSHYRIHLYDASVPEQIYDDVPSSAWYADEVAYVTKKGLMNGTGGSNFGPGAQMTRAMLWTILARMEEVDTSTGSTWYEAGRQWAMDAGISDGASAMGNITREQLVTMLWRYAQYKGYDVSEGENTNILSYEDAFQISEWAFSSLQWACGEGLIQGDGGKLNPGGNATRAQVAAILMRFCENIA